jgi:ParB family chromosome partitioning protein
MSDSIAQIPLNKLSPSALNVRKKDRKVDIDALAASILAHGLLQNLNVIAKDDDKFEVVAGGRRLAALKALVKAGAIPKHFPVACRILADDQAREASLAENIQRVDMDAMDEVDAYGQLVDDGASPEDVARRFGVTLRHVQQRLALAKLSPKIKAAWKRGDVTLDAARAFCLVDDHAQQEAVFKSLGKPITHSSTVRSRMMGERMRGGDRLATFVGLEAYELAGGVVVRDLFDENAVFIENPALMTQLAEQKLEAHRLGFMQAGWGWVELNLTNGSVTGSRIQPDWRDHTPEEEAELTRLRSEIETLDEALDVDSVEDDPRWDQRDELAGQVEAIRQEARVWDSELMPLAGVVLSIGHDGDFNVARGIVRPEDEKAVRDVRKSRQAADRTDEDLPDADDAVVEMTPESGLPKTVIRELSLARTRAIRLALVRSPEIALSVTVAAMLARSALRFSLPGIDISAHSVSMEDLDETRAAMASHDAMLPESGSEVLVWCLNQPQDRLLHIMAVLTARAVDLSHEKGAPSDRSLQMSADVLCEALSVDMRETWRADGEYWTRLPKSELMTAITTAPTTLAMSNAKRSEFLKACAKLKKDELAVKAEAAYAGSHYLPEMLVQHMPETTSLNIESVPELAA